MKARPVRIAVTPAMAAELRPLIGRTIRLVDVTNRAHPRTSDDWTITLEPAGGEQRELWERRS